MLIYLQNFSNFEEFLNKTKEFLAKPNLFLCCRCEYVLQQKGVEFDHQIVSRNPNLRRPLLYNPANIQFFCASPRM